MDTATRRGRGKEGGDLKNNGNKNLYIRLSQILPLFLVLLPGKWLYSGSHTAMSFPLLREYDADVCVFSILLYLVFQFFLFLPDSDESIFIGLLTYFYTLLFSHWSMFLHVLYIVYFSYVFKYFCLCYLLFFLPLNPSFGKLHVCVPG